MKCKIIHGEVASKVEEEFGNFVNCVTFINNYKIVKILQNVICNNASSCIMITIIYSDKEPPC